MSDTPEPTRPPRRQRVVRLDPTLGPSPAGTPRDAPTVRDVHALSLMRAQRRLSSAIAAVSLVMLFGLPALLALVPGLSEVRVAGVSAMWVVLGVLIYPVLWTVGRFYESNASRLEDEYRQALEGTDS
ncbi:DUF485 domain-containing protein [Micrococcales bacterium 31B]|nr:DUF485 domain-containing protein [Micrococcales bacterium 31B]